MFTNNYFSLCANCEDFLYTMEEFSTLCLNTEAKIDFFIKQNKPDGKVNLLNVIEYTKDYNIKIENPLKLLHVSKTEVDREVDNIESFVLRFVELHIPLILFSLHRLKIEVILPYSNFKTLRIR